MEITFPGIDLDFGGPVAFKKLEVFVKKKNMKHESEYLLRVRKPIKQIIN